MGYIKMTLDAVIVALKLREIAQVFRGRRGIHETVGILNQGRGTRIEDCEFDGFDKAIDNRAEDLRIKRTSVRR